jgi:hypothetical protein
MCYFFYFCYMSKGRYNYYDPEYNPQVTEGNELLLTVNNTSFSFVILQTASKKVLVWGENYPLSELQEPDDLQHVLSAKYDQVKAVVQSASFTVIPKDLYNENDIDQYSRFLTVEPTDTVLVNELDTNNYVIFKVNEILIKALEKHVDLKSIFIAGKVLIAAVSSEKSEAVNLYAHIEENKLQLLYLKDDLLNFYNSYEFNNPDELMYFIVLTTNELDLNLDEISLILSGEVNLSDKKIQRVSDLLSKVYLNQTQIVSLPQGFLPHQILLLSGLTLCESLVEN